MPFVVSYGGQEWRTEDLTLDEAIVIQKATGRGWMQLNPFLSAEDCKEIIVTFLAREMDRVVAATKVGALSVKDALDGVKVVKDDLPDVYEDGNPKAGDGPSTDG